MIGQANSFRTLFRKYRLRAEFITLSALGMALAEKGLIYEDSIFSHWQKGDRLPNRATLLKLFEIFIERKAITTLDEVNEFLSSANQGYISEEELQKFPVKLHNPIFQVPNEIINFTGRQDVINKLIHKDITGKIVLIHGAAGVGKTALAIRLGHILSDAFSDGVLWYKVDSSRITDILLSIAASFGEDIGYIDDVEIRASTVRSILSNKNVLLILDSLDEERNLHLLLPNSNSCLTIITSRNNFLRIAQSYVDIPLAPFTVEESLQLFRNIFGENFVTKNRKAILMIGEKVGNLPLAVHMLAKQLQQSKYSIISFLDYLERETFSLKTLSYENKNLYLAIQLSYNSLSQEERKFFVSLGIFEGKDFSLEAVAYINTVSEDVAEKRLESIIAVSLIEPSTQKRYRIHPMIKQFAREKLTDMKLYALASKYYENLLIDSERKKNFKILLKQELDNIIYIFNFCYKLEYWDQVTKLWNQLKKYLVLPKQHNKIRPLIETIDTKSPDTIWPKNRKFLLICILLAPLLFSYSFFIASAESSTAWSRDIVSKMDAKNFSIVASFFINVILFFIICFRLPSTKANVAFMVTVLGIAGWCFSMIFYRASDLAGAEVWAKLLYFFPTFIPSSLLLFALHFPNFSTGRKTVFAIITANLILALFVLLPGAIIQDISQAPSKEKVVNFGWAYPLYVIYIPTFFVASFISLFRNIRIANPYVRMQLKYTLFGIFFASNPAMVTNLFLPTVGYVELNWIGPVFTFIWAGSVTYTIVKYRFLDIPLIVANRDRLRK